MLLQILIIMTSHKIPDSPLMNGLGHAFYEKLTCPKTERLVRLVEGGEAHCQMNNPSLKHQIEFDWLDEVFK